MAPEPLPTFVYKIVPSAPPTPIPSEYPLSELDQKDGFVHLSIGTQVSIPNHSPRSSSMHVSAISYPIIYHIGD